LKICDIVQFHSPLSGGVKRYVEDKSRFLATVPGARHVVVIPSDRNGMTEHGAVRTYTVRSPRIPGSKSYRFLVSAARIDSIIERERPDVVEVGDPYLAAWAAWRAASRRGIPVAAFYHSDYPRALERSIRKCAGPAAAAVLAWPIRYGLRSLYRRMDATLAATRQTARILAALRVPRVVNMPLGTDTDAFAIRPSRETVRHALGLPEEARLLLYVGRLAREKNIEALLGSMDRLEARAGETRLLIVGDGECAGRVRRRCRTDARVLWRPYCSDARSLSEFYSAADLFVHPGTAETFGFTAVEAQACGTRVIGVRGGGLEEVLDGESPLILAEAATPEALASAVKAALAVGEPPSARQRRRERVVARFSHRETFARLLAFYRGVSATRARSDRAPFDSAVASGPHSRPQMRADTPSSSFVFS
jgi:alpha-1,6-mannosyltransferase